MTNTSKTIIFFGNERLVSGLDHTDAPILNGLIEHGYTVAAVVSNHTEATSRKSRPLEVAAVAEAHGIPVLLPKRPMDIYEELKAIGAEAAVLSAYGRIIPQEIIDLFPKGIINIHPSLLPRYRGSTPIESAIMNGDTETGVSIMQLAAAMDAGPVFTQEKIALNGNEDKFDLYRKLSAIGADLLFSVLPSILSGELLPKPQAGTPTYCALLKKENGLINPLVLTASEIERKVRAYLNFPKTKLTLLGQLVTITSVHVSNEQTSPLDVACKDGRFLVIDELVGPSGRRMSGQAFLNGYRIA